MLKKLKEEEKESLPLSEKVLRSLKDFGIRISWCGYKPEGIIADLIFLGRRVVVWAKDGSLETFCKESIKIVTQIIIEESLSRGDYKILYEILKDYISKKKIDFSVEREDPSVVIVKKKRGFGFHLYFPDEINEEARSLFKLLLYLKDGRVQVPLKVFKKILTFAKILNYF